MLFTSSLPLGSVWVKERTGARGIHVKGEGGPAREAHENRFNTFSEGAEFPIG